MHNTKNKEVKTQKHLLQYHMGKDYTHLSINDIEKGINTIILFFVKYFR